MDIFGQEEIYACGGLLGEGIILKSTGSSFISIAESKIVPSNQVFNPYLFGTIGSIWLDENSTLYATGDFLYRYKFGEWEYIKGLPGNKAYDNLQAQYRGYVIGIRGNASNNIWICGERNTLMHFNGITWKQIGLPYDPNSEIIWRTIRVKGNTVIVIGDIGNKAAVMMIKK